MKNILLVSIFISNLSFGQIEILSEDFQNGIPLNWTVVNNDFLTPVDPLYNDAWISIVDPDNSLDTVISSTSYFSTAGNSSRWIITPSLALGAFGNILEWNAKSHDASFPDDYLVLVSSTDNQLSSFNDTVGYIQNENFEWINRSVNLSFEGYNNQSIYVAFINTTLDGYKLYLDSISVTKNSTLLINTLKEDKISFSPNPAKDVIHFQSESPISSISIYSTTGQLLVEQTNPSVAIASLIPGVYFAEIILNNSKITKRFIKE